jgi:hypothetical protein
MSAWPYGTIANWPNDPPALAMPSAMLRFSGETTFATTPSTTPKVVPESARPMSRPAERPKATGVEETAMEARPSA